MRAALVASCLRGALPPVDLRAVCLVRAMVAAGVVIRQEKTRGEEWGAREGFVGWEREWIRVTARPGFASKAQPEGAVQSGDRAVVG